MDKTFKDKSKHEAQGQKVSHTLSILSAFLIKICHYTLQLSTVRRSLPAKPDEQSKLTVHYQEHPNAAPTASAVICTTLSTVPSEVKETSGQL